MSDSNSTPAVPSAEELRMQILERELERASEADKLKDAEKKRLDAFTDDFLHGEITEEERAMIRRLVANAVKDGKFEALIYSFPSDLCTDGGRAINSNDPRWPETLTGKARMLYDRYEEAAKPAGYRLKAMIINFPGGIPGDVGFLLNWSPEHA